MNCGNCFLSLVSLGLAVCVVLVCRHTLRMANVSAGKVQNQAADLPWRIRAKLRREESRQRPEEGRN